MSDKMLEQPTQEQVQAMVDVWRAWNDKIPSLRSSINTLMRRAYCVAMEIKNG